MQCNSTASAGDEATCQSSLANLQMFGLCGGGGGDGGVPPRDAGAPRDAGPPRDSGPAGDASVAQSCIDLALCCPSTADPIQCESIATSGIDLICSLFAVQLGCICASRAAGAYQRCLGGSHGRAPRACGGASAVDVVRYVSR